MKRPPLLPGLCLVLVLCSCGDPVPGEAQDAAPEDMRAPETGGPHDSSADVRPDLMEAVPARAAPGEAIELAFPQQTPRGVGYVLEERAGERWESRFFLTATAQGYGLDEPQWAPADEEYVWDDVGIDGPGPDVIRLPDTAAPGTYRLCTANAPTNFCTELEVTPPE